MPWVKVDDHFPDHHKLAELGDAAPLAGWLYLCALAWANRQLTDGRIPKGQIYRLLSVRGLSLHGAPVDLETLAEGLVRVGLWHDLGAHYQIHDYAHYQPTREQVHAERARNLARKPVRRRTSAGTAGTTPGGTAGGTSEVPPVPRRYPARGTNGPVPVPLDQDQELRSPASGRRVPQLWKSQDPSAPHVGLLARLAQDLLETDPSLAGDLVTFTDVLKTRSAALRVSYDSRSIAKAIDGVAYHAAKR